MVLSSKPGEHLIHCQFLHGNQVPHRRHAGKKFTRREADRLGKVLVLLIRLFFNKC